MAKNTRINLTFSDNEIIDPDYDYLVTSQEEYEQHIRLANKIRESSEHVKLSTNFEPEMVSLHSIFQKAYYEKIANSTDGSVIDFEAFRKKCNENWKRLWGLFNITPDILFNGAKKEGFSKDEELFLIKLFTGDMHMLHSTIVKNKSWSDDEKRQLLECVKFLYKMCYRRNVLSEEIKTKLSVLPYDNRFRFNRNMEEMKVIIEDSFDITVFANGYLPILEREEWQKRMVEDIKQRLAYWRDVYQYMDKLYNEDENDLYYKAHKISDYSLLEDAVEQVEKKSKGQNS